MSFLKCWIAIETLAMPDITNVVPINEILAKIYSITITDAAKQFFVGRIHGLRSDIVHDGIMIPINPGVTDYLQAMYFDLLSHIAEIKSERRLESALKNESFRIETYITQYAKARKLDR